MCQKIVENFVYQGYIIAEDSNKEFREPPPKSDQSFNNRLSETKRIHVLQGVPQKIVQ